MFHTRQEVVAHLAAASLSGTLGLFIGAGFSKSLTKGGAPSWGQLLQLVAGDLGLPDPLANPVAMVGASFPRIATQMATELERKLDARFSADPIARRTEAVRQLKVEVSRKTALTADAEMSRKMREVMRLLEPAWVVTTNYDFLVEECLDYPTSLLPDQVLCVRRGTVPVFHIHGHILSPSSIVLLEEDYVAALVQSGYRHVRLGVLFAESTALMLGYAFGDMNIQTAIHYSRAYHPNSNELDADDIGHVVFLNRTNSPDDSMRRDIWGELVVSAAEIYDFLLEVGTQRIQLASYRATVKAFMDNIAANPHAQQSFAYDANWRRLFIEAVRQVPAVFATGAVVQFVQQALSEVARKASGGMSGWPHYKPWLEAVLDVLQQWPVGTLPPQLFEYFARELESLAPLIEPSGHRYLGYAWDATEVWHARKSIVFGGRPELLRTLRNYAERQRSDKLLMLLQGVG